MLTTKKTELKEKQLFKTIFNVLNIENSKIVRIKQTHSNNIKFAWLGHSTILLSINNKVILIGRVGKDAEIKNFEEGNSLVKFLRQIGHSIFLKSIKQFTHIL